jgi:tetratricopeptide (TPR) repeat protein
MRTHRVIHAAVATLVAIVAGLATSAHAQEMSPQEHFEAGHYNEAIQAVPGDAGDDLKYLAAQAHQRLQHPDEAKALFQQLGGGDEGNAWTFVGRSAVAQVDGDVGGSEAAARRAVELNGGLAEAHYQLGQALYAASNWAAAAEAFTQAGQIAPRHAYAHYYAGQSYYRAKRVDRMAQHFEYFLKLAPQAPEAPQVSAVMRTVRGR